MANEAGYDVVASSGHGDTACVVLTACVATLAEAVLLKAALENHFPTTIGDFESPIVVSLRPRTKTTR